MFGQVRRAGQLLSSNVESMLDKATDPRKLMLLLRSEIEDELVALQGERTKTHRDADRLEAAAKAKADVAEERTGKAKLAVDKGRQDLARSALLTRESERKLAAELQAEAEETRAEVARIDSAIAELEAKREDTLARLDAMPAPSAKACTAPSRPTRADGRLDRVEAMEQRIDFTTSRAADPVPANVDEEIARLEQESAIEAELAAMQGKGMGKGKGKSKK
ncbi:PspA/IM30 family protein [Aurantiacibacter rhizosphaerae]|uniref:PspA/IM30 family protein n=1 Tax=Aurantiacibacter rhizosphaerae TaxID=2691582 RepID=A0A844XER9_9SPHN|nr:PspA/IM30 family protein [Aurantiacibacter rhizosphaerae]MWV28977.1 hypothetical protein [Aurantiacibacter rhizosphaerae]